MTTQETNKTIEERYKEFEETLDYESVFSDVGLQRFNKKTLAFIKTEISQAQQQTKKDITKRVEGIEDKPITSIIHTRDIIQVSTTDIVMFKNEGFNQGKQEALKAINEE